MGKEAGQEELEEEKPSLRQTWLRAGKQEYGCRGSR